MPKKKVNPFWAFLMEFKRDNKIESIDEAKAKADVVWRSMTDAEKKMYAGRSKPKETPLTELEIKRNEEILQKQKMVEEISTELNIAKKYNNLQNTNFFLIHINSFCTDHQINRTYPCEIGISGFSLQGGVSLNDVYHSLIYPGPLPPGYSGLAKTVSESTHQLPWEGITEDNQEEIFEDIIKFLTARSDGSRRLPILYAIKERDLEMVRNVLDVWCDMFNPRINFTVYNAQTLFSLLHKNIVQNSQWPSEAVSYQEFEKDIHQYAPGIACEYHESSECPIHCSRSIAVRYGYIICENVCPELGIQLIPGFHVPSNILRHEVKRTKALKKNYDSSSIGRDTEDTCSTVRDDESDVDTVASMSRTGTYNEESVSSIGFPEYDDMRGSLSNEIKTGSSGFSRKPAALPSSLDKTFTNLTSSQDSAVNKRNEWPSLRGRGGGVPKARGRGNPFRK